MKKGDRVILAKRSYLGAGTVISLDKDGVLVLWDRQNGKEAVLYPKESLECSK